MFSCKSDGRPGSSGVVAQDVAKYFVQDFGLNGLLDKVFRALLERRENVLLVTDGGDHDNTGVRMLTHDSLDSLDAFHLRHGDIHEHDVRRSALELGDSGEAVTGFTGDFSTKELDHLDDVLAREDGIIHDEIANGFVVFAK